MRDNGQIFSFFFAEGEWDTNMHRVVDLFKSEQLFDIG